MGIRALLSCPAGVEIRIPLFPFLFSIFLFLGACASPGEPTVRRAPVPAPITDLSAKQSGNGAVLAFSLPRDTIELRLLKRTPAIEIYRGFSSPAAQMPPTATVPLRNTAVAETSRAATPSVSAHNLSLVVTIPSALVSHYQQDGAIRYTDAWTPEVIQQHAGEFVTYMVRTAESQKESSPDSNLATLPVYQAPNPISDLKAQLALAAIDLSWTAPQQVLLRHSPAIDNYEIYRSELSSAVTSQKPATMPQVFPIPSAKEASTEPVKIATTPSTGYEDTQVTLGATYRYFVRSVVEYSGKPIESADSNVVTITMHDVFPPSIPTGLVLVPLSAENGTPAHIDLSWNVNPETDVAGYNVYRSEQEGTQGLRLNSQLLPTPVFSDMSAVAGRHYFYRVTAVDRSGNESKPSAAISGEIPAESQPKQ